ncbi:MAG: exodeoxyribonuclease VII large subunit, partial [Candidatus Methylomirabilis sp.]|nr:exodeoxyribonuclease VII large subunit [Deltaproteobacteria bacterium]
MPAGRAEPEVYSVARLTAELKGLIESRYPSVWVEGELSNFRPHSSGHWYFTLKDADATLGGVMFRRSNARVRFRPQDGMHVRVFGAITVYPPQGKYQVLCELMEEQGVGALQRAFEELKRRLQAEGLFAEAHKAALPEVPSRVGVVTSPTGAALRDILNVLARRFPGLRVLIAPCRVQGEGAAEEIAQAIRRLDARGDVDVMIVGRGGGSLEDLWA